MKVKVDELKFELFNLSELDLISYLVEDNYAKLDIKSWYNVILFFEDFGLKPLHISNYQYNGIIFNEIALFYSPESEKYFRGKIYEIDDTYFKYCKEILNFKFFKKVEEEKDEPEIE